LRIDIVTVAHPLGKEVRAVPVSRPPANVRGAVHTWHVPLFRTPSLLTTIERDLEQDAPVAKILRKVLLLGGQAGSTELRDWAAHELRGYGPGDDLPDYRQLHALLQADFAFAGGMVKHQTVAPWEFPEFAHDAMSGPVPLAMGIAEIQDMTTRHEGGMIRLSPPGVSELMLLINSEVGHINKIVAIYWSVSVTALEGVLDQVRTRLVQLAAEMRAETPSMQSVPEREVADRAVHVVAKGRSTVNVVTGGPSSSNSVTMTSAAEAPPSAAGWTWKALRGIASIAVGLATIAAAIFAWPAFDQESWSAFTEWLRDRL
jgi:hypothetical protein